MIRKGVSNSNFLEFQLLGIQKFYIGPEIIETNRGHHN